MARAPQAGAECSSHVSGTVGLARPLAPRRSPAQEAENEQTAHWTRGFLSAFQLNGKFNLMQVIYFPGWKSGTYRWMFEEESWVTCWGRKWQERTGVGRAKACDLGAVRPPESRVWGCPSHGHSVLLWVRARWASEALVRGLEEALDLY